MGLGLPQSGIPLGTLEADVSQVRKQALLEAWHCVGAGGCMSVWRLKEAAIPQG